MKRTRDGEDAKRECLVVNQAALCSLINFYDSDEVTKKCCNVMNAHVFEGNYSFYIGIRPEGKSEAKERPSLFNTSFYLDQMRRELTRGRDYIHAIGGVALWAVKDLARWLQLYVNATNDMERSEIGLPFGVLEVWEYTLELEMQPTGRRYRYRVVPLKETRKDCVFYFYDHNMTLLPLDDNKLGLYERRAGALLSIAKHSGAPVKMNSYSSTQQRIPQSPFYHLANLSEELERVRSNLLDADWLASHPKPLFRANVADPIPGHELGDADLYNGNSIYGASLAARDRARQMTLQQVVDMLAALRAAEGMSTDKDTPRQQQRRYYRYPDMLDDASTMLESVELLHWANPTVINDYTQRLEEYKLGVITAMGLSETSRFAQALLGKVAHEATGLGGKSHIAMLVDRNERDAVSEFEQRIYERLFRAMYDMCGFRNHDAFAVSALVTALGDLITREEDRRLMIKNYARFRATLPKTPAKAAEMMLRAEDSDEETAKKKKGGDEDEDDNILYKLRVSVSDMRDWLARTTSGKGEVFELIFENSDDDVIKLQFYQEMAATGRVSIKELERQARRVYGEELKLEQQDIEKKTF